MLMALMVAAGSTAAAETVRFPGAGLELVGRLYVPEGKGPFPALVLMHGCGGMWGANGEPTPSYDDWARRLQARGYLAVLLDSFGPRKVREICTQRERAVSPAWDRTGDAYAALEWLVRREDVLSRQVHVMGWSNGGSAVLHTIHAEAPDRGARGPGFRSAIAFYPGCAAGQLRSFKSDVPLLIQAGGADDWTPARHCEALARRAAAEGRRVEIDVYPGAHHAFDRIGGTVRHRPDVRNLASASGWGATIGPDPGAREKARQRTFAFLEAQR